MPMPQEYQLASQQYESFLADAQDALGLTTRNQTYTSVQAVLLVFRRRLDAEQVLSFADTLPAVLRAIFTSGWSSSDYTADFGAEHDWAAEVKALRAHHNFADDKTPARVVEVLRSRVDLSRFEQVLGQIGPDALRFWGFEVSAEAEAKREISEGTPSQTEAL
ncbi:DUF2267 domain-containing protein [Pseudovibrio sp. Alg231-02]|uniref:DUF2267 domain-containing protein n=1 Tax=Pseudovibrio sp. Alg231-02 TaxID=1922223 RepID=UPI001AD8E6E1|nr:DUF2267 domain-containing protein [Pseudovibrio sp. Alg231-02]